MKRVKHKFMYSVYSDWNLDHAYSPYERKYNYSCYLEFGLNAVLCHVNSSGKDKYISSLRELVLMKHKVMRLFNTNSKPTNEDMPAGVEIIKQLKENT